MSKKIKFCKGFTLVEVIVVVVISLIVVSFSVPVYKKTQEKNRYRAAQGVLVDLANGLRMLTAEHPNISITSAAVSSNGDTGTANVPADNAVHWMMTHEYINRINFVDSKYLRYSFKISTTGQASCAESCGKSNAIACMYDVNALAEYQCSWVDFQGTLH